MKSSTVFFSWQFTFSYLTARSAPAPKEHVLRYALGYTLRHEVPQLRRSVYFGMPLGIPFEHFQEIPCHVGRGNFPFRQPGVEFNDIITSNN